MTKTKFAVLHLAIAGLLVASSACLGGRVAAADTPRHAAPPPAPAPRRPRPETKVDVEDPRDYLDQKIIAMFMDHHATNGHFKFSVVPITPELWVAGEYPQWSEKRFTPQQMEQRVDEQLPIFDDSVLAILTIVFVGDLFSTGRVQFEVPEDICEYIFLENDRGQSLRCSRATLPLMRMPGPFTKQVNIDVEFGNLRSAEPDFFDTKSLKFVVGGLDFRHNEITYPYPLSDLFGDAPEALRALYRATGIWSR